MSIKFIFDDGDGNKYQVKTMEELKELYKSSKNKKKITSHIWKYGFPWYEEKPEILKKINF